MKGQHSRRPAWLRRHPGATPAGATLFDVATEEPDLLKADTRARVARSRATPGRSRGGGGGRSMRAGGVVAATPPTRSLMDPRIAARRHQVQADAQAALGRRRRRWATVGVGLVVVVSAATLTMLSPLAALRRVQVVGAAHTGVEAVRTVVGLEPGTPLVRLDIAGVEDRLRALPWVAVARVERQWPRTVVVVLEERVPVAVTACVPEPEAGCLVDRTGRVLSTSPSSGARFLELPRLSGLPAADEPGSQMAGTAQGSLAVAAALPSALRPLVVGVRGEGREVSLDLQGPGRSTSSTIVRLGPPDRIAEKLTAASTVLARTSTNGVAVVDVRVPESPALTRVRR